MQVSVTHYIPSKNFLCSFILTHVLKRSHSVSDTLVGFEAIKDVVSCRIFKCLSQENICHISLFAKHHESIEDVSCVSLNLEVDICSGL